MLRPVERPDAIAHDVAVEGGFEEGRVRGRAQRKPIWLPAATDDPDRICRWDEPASARTIPLCAKRRWASGGCGGGRNAVLSRRSCSTRVSSSFGVVPIS